MAITGSSGFLGTALTRRLLAAGSRVLPVQRRHDGGLVPLPGRADAVVHLAFPTAPDARHADPLGTLARVVQEAAQAAALTRALGARHLVLLSSGKVFGAGTAWPADEATPAVPTTSLGHLKLAAEQVCAAAAALEGSFGASLVRLFNAYGPGQAGEFFFPQLLRQLAAGGPLRLGELGHHRDWIHVDDVTAALLCALEHPAGPGEVRPLVLGTGSTATVEDILGHLRVRLGTLPPVEVEVGRRRPGEAPSERADPRALRALGWSPQVPLEAGIDDLLVVPARDRPPGARTR